MTTKTAEGRRRSQPGEEAYLARVGERVRTARARRGMSRKVLSQASGVSERYLAELERGAGNASLLVLRQIAAAMDIRIGDLVTDGPERSIDLTLALNQIERLSPGELAEARGMMTGRFGRLASRQADRIALIGLRGAGKTALGRPTAQALGLPFIELDKDIERMGGLSLAELFVRHGQARFRKLERACLEEVVKTREKAVIATGGGLVTEPATFDLLLQSCFVIWLTATPAEHMARVAAQGDLRPMVASGEAMEDLEAILDSRRGLYAMADATFETSGQSEAEALAGLLSLIKGRA